jgi:molecular chaperone GrpE
MTDEHRKAAPDHPAAEAPAQAAGEASLEARLAAAEAERDESRDRLLRTAAEFDNYRKRVERERREQADLATTDVLLGILAVTDDFDRALAADPGATAESVEAYRRGVALIHDNLHELLRRYGVRRMETIGQAFDPTLHEAALHEPSDAHHEGEVTGELRPGYMRGDRLLRPAVVKVAKA